jgi:glycosyltransferase involved in cell wall biosynthesis
MTMLDEVGRVGGGETIARWIATGLDPDRFESWVCGTRWDESQRDDPVVAKLLEALEARGGRFVGLERSSRLALASWRRFVATLREERVGILHAHLFGSSFWAALLGPRGHVPVIVAHDHNWSFEGRRTRRVIDRRLIGPRCSAYLTVAEESRRKMIEVEHLDPRKLRVLANGIPEVQTAGRQAARAALGVDADTPLVGTVAVLRPEKALHVLIEAAAIVARDLPGLRVIIVGEGPERARLEELIAARGLDGTVSLLGVRHDVPDLLEAFDVAVCCSEWEGSPISILEYMRAGLPTVASDVGGIPSLIEDGREGVLVPSGDAAGFAEAIAVLLSDQARRAETGRRARERQRREFSLDGMLARIEALYEELWQARQGGGR